MPTPTYVAIAKTVLTGTQASVTLSAIPSTYTDLLLVVSARSDFASAADWITIQFNSQTTGYSNRYLYGDGSSVLSSSSTYNIVARNTAPGSTATSNTFCNMEVYMPNYTGSTYKVASVSAVSENNNATAAYIYAGAALSSNTAATASIFIDCDNGSFVSGSRFDLYGIKNS
jgi:hypothetical protein